MIAKKRFLNVIRFVNNENTEGNQNIALETDEVRADGHLPPTAASAALIAPPRPAIPQIKHIIRKNYMLIRSVFFFFCARGTTIGEASFSMKLNSWITFCREVRPCASGGVYCPRGSSDASEIISLLPLLFPFSTLRSPPLSPHLPPRIFPRSPSPNPPLRMQSLIRGAPRTPPASLGSCLGPLSHRSTSLTPSRSPATALPSTRFLLP